ncbi:hypothetical protein [Pengzhenrongella sp.]|uniref:hypothetical protein n=1 Tax=Pengzhenrongella sp. TaxID=2888820 RepID=UPI002F92A763
MADLAASALLLRDEMVVTRLKDLDQVSDESGTFGSATLPFRPSPLLRPAPDGTPVCDDPVHDQQGNRHADREQEPSRCFHRSSIA